MTPVFRPARSILGCFCILILHAAAHADCFDQASELYDRASFEDALLVLDSCQISDSLRQSRVERLAGVIHATKYASYGEVADKFSAERRFTAAIRLDPFLEMQEDEFPPWAVGLFNMKRSELIAGEVVALAGSRTSDDINREALRMFIERYATSTMLEKPPAPEWLERVFYSTPDRFITVSRVNSESESRAPMIQVLVNSDSILRVISENALILDKVKQPTVEISCEELVSGGPSSQVVATTLRGYLADLGFKVFGPGQGADIRITGQATGSANTLSVAGAKIQTGVASIQVSLEWAATGKQISATSQDTTVDARGKSDEAAARQGLQAAASRVKDEVAAALILHWNEAAVKGRYVQFVFHNVQSRDVQPIVDQLTVLTQATSAGEPVLQKETLTVFVQSRQSPQQISKVLESDFVAYKLKLTSIDLARVEAEIE